MACPNRSRAAGYSEQNKYGEKLHRDFIQKYAETKLATLSKQFTTFAYYFGPIAFFVAAMLYLSSNPPPKDIVNQGLIIVLFILVCVFIFLGYQDHKKDYVLGRIIIRIEDINKLTTQEPVESHIISKLNEINNKVDALNPRIDALGKTLSTKIKANIDFYKLIMSPLIGSFLITVYNIQTSGFNFTNVIFLIASFILLLILGIFYKKYVDQLKDDYQKIDQET